MIRTILIVLVIVGGIWIGYPHFTMPTQSAIQPEPWETLIGKPAPEWSIENWVNSEPISISDLRGKVVLIRWWLESCPYCQASAPALNEFFDAYKDQGLVVIGMYHEKPMGRNVTAENVRQFAEIKGFEFPIAIDHQWHTLRKFWPPDIEMNFTSVSFLIDKEGTINHIHPGGSYNIDSQPFNDPQWRRDYFELKSRIEELL